MGFEVPKNVSIRGSTLIKALKQKVSTNRTAKLKGQHHAVDLYVRLWMRNTYKPSAHRERGPSGCISTSLFKACPLSVSDTPQAHRFNC